MVDFVRKRLQVFVSSTFTDLIPERQAAVEAILTAGHIPAGMELFTAGDESQMTVIKQWIDESDVYLLILGGRYGSIEPTTNKSYIQLEYEYAIEKNKPLFACVITPNAIEQRVKQHGTKVIEQQEPKELEAFRELVCSKMVRMWNDAKDIKIAVSESLSYFARRDDLKGWVRESEQANAPAALDEIARLSRENADLRRQIADTDTAALISGLTFKEMKSVLRNEKVLLAFLKFGKTGSHSGLSFGDFDRLRDRGLVEGHPNSVKITPDGRSFLNRFLAEGLNKNKDRRVKKNSND